MRLGYGPPYFCRLGRALGETMAVMMVAGNVVRWPMTPFEPVRTPSCEHRSGDELCNESHLEALYVSGLLLLILALLLIGLARIYGSRTCGDSELWRGRALGLLALLVMVAPLSLLISVLGRVTKPSWSFLMMNRCKRGEQGELGQSFYRLHWCF